MNLRHALCAAAAVVVAAPAIAGPIEVTNTVMTEKHVAEHDGTTRITLAPAGRVTPGDHVVYQIGFTNTGPQPVSGLVVSNPIPHDLVYVAPAAGSPAPELSVDGTTFGSLAALRVKGPNGALRPADASDVKAIRWRVLQPLAAGGHGQFAYQALLK